MKTQPSSEPANAGSSVAKSFCASKESAKRLEGFAGKPKRIFEIASIFECAKHATENGAHISAKLIASKVLERNHDVDEGAELVRKALNIVEKHKGEIHHRGEDPVRDYYRPIALMIAGMQLDKGAAEEKAKSKSTAKAEETKFTTVIASLLYEIMARDLITYDEVKKQFGKDVADLTKQLDIVTRAPITLKMYDRNGNWTAQEAKFNEIQLGLARDLLHCTNDPARVWLVKEATALQRLRVTYKEQRARDIANPMSSFKRLNYKDPEKGHDYKEMFRYMLHIQGMYLPVAREMGQPFYGEMQELLLKILDPGSETKIKQRMEALKLKGVKNGKNLSKAAVDKYISKILNLTKDSGCSVAGKCRMEGRVKEDYSNWEKMLGKQNCGETYVSPIIREINFDQYFDLVHDRLALRIIIDDPDPISCKKLLNFIAKKVDLLVENGANQEENHIRWDSFKDYVKKPKKNGYSALHCCMVIDGTEIEVQIVTEDMHKNNSWDVASHAVHKNGRDKVRVEDNNNGKYHPTRQLPYDENPKQLASLIAAIKYNMLRLINGGVSAPYPKRDFIVVQTESSCPDTGNGKSSTLRKTHRGITFGAFCGEIHSALPQNCYGVKLNGNEYYLKDHMKLPFQKLENGMRISFLKDWPRSHIYRRKSLPPPKLMV